MLVVTVVMREEGNACLIQGTWLCYQHTTIFDNYYRFCGIFLILNMLFLFVFYFLWMLSLLNSEVFVLFSEVILNITSSFVIFLCIGLTLISNFHV